MKTYECVTVRLFYLLLALTLAPIHHSPARAQEPGLVPSLIWNVTATSNRTPADDDLGPENIVNRSGLNGSHQHSNSLGDMWLAMQSDEPIYVQFEFEDVYQLEEMWVWNYNEGWFLERGVKDAMIEYSQDGIDWTRVSQG